MAAVIGGCLLTGGYGSVVGASLGALIFGMTEIGIVNLNWNSDWFKLFVGVMLPAGRAGQPIRPQGRRTEQEVAPWPNQPTPSGTKWKSTNNTWMRDAPLLEIQNITKTFGSVISLSEISTTVRAGQVTCVLGDNGAGQVDVHQDPGRGAPAGSGPVADRRQARRPAFAEGIARRRHRHGLPGPGHGSADGHLAELLPRFRTDQGLGSVQAVRRRPGQVDHPQGDGRHGYRHP